MPRGPVLDWSNLRIVNAPGISSVEDLPHQQFTTSGRAAIYQALLQLDLPRGAGVLVPTYHCPTIVAPVVLAQHEPMFYAVREDGLPDLDGIAHDDRSRAKAIIVPHYFGLTQSLRGVRAWCDQHGIALIEDCAHSFFGEAGERPVGAWGDFATASLSKFLPVPEAGLLGSALRPVRAPQFERPGLRAEIKGTVDVLELSVRHGRLAGLRGGLSLLFKLKNARHTTGTTLSTETAQTPATEQQMLLSCDMGRIAQRPLLASMVLKNMLPRGRIIKQRQRNYAIYAEMLAAVPGARPLKPGPIRPAAPYVFPLWVDDADRVYDAMRNAGLPVFRWDRIWPGTPVLPGDVGLQWARNVLQLLCHQDLSESDVRHTATVAAGLLRTPASTQQQREKK